MSPKNGNGGGRRPPNAPQASPPLSGVRVLDLTTFLSGPYATQLMGDLGAEVIKVEAPGGDLSRHIPPHFVGGDSLYYLAVNRNKRSITADLKVAEGVALVRRLALASDIVVENNRPGVLDRLGLRASELRAEKPELIWCAISGFGQDGPYRDKPAYDMIVQALAGGMSLTGEPGRAAVRAGIPIGDLAAGLYAVVAVLAALHRRKETGQGETVDVSMLDCQAAMLCYQGAYHLHSGVVPGRQGAAHDAIPTYRAFPAAGGTELVVTANTERMWRGLVRALGRDDLASDPRFVDGGSRHAHRLDLWPELEAAFMLRTADEWVPLLEAEGIPVGVVNTLDRVVSDPQLLHRGMVMDLTARDGREVRVMGDPVKLADTRTRAPGYPPSLGADGSAVLQEVLGMSEGEVAVLVSKGAVLPCPGWADGRGDGSSPPPRVAASASLAAQAT